MASRVVCAASAPVPIMVNDLTGKMGRAVADAVVARGADQCFLVPVALSGQAKDPVDVGGVEVEIRSVLDGDAGATLDELKSKYPGMIVVDYTLPAAVNANASLYVKHGTPFVMGTTGGDRESLADEVRASRLPAVIAPQMGKQVVAFQAAMRLMAENFPGAFTGYTLTVTESHQSSKVDTSGTAKAIVQSFNDLGCGFDIEDARLVRDEPTQLGEMRVPKEHLLGHAFHTYKLTSPDGSVGFEFQHNVCGRSIYAEGTVDAALFLAQKTQSATSPGEETLFDMIDVLKEGGMVTN
jgi:4-hydroxy-tetrahydrodipicolinate reductase